MLDSFSMFARFIASAMLLICFSSLEHVSAQIKLEVDEEVQVKYHNQWRDGVVLEKGKNNQYLVSFVFISEKQKVFPRFEIRKLCEVGALDFCRTWESTNGTFKVQAAPKRLNETSVLLVKNDLTELDVPLVKLSSKDVAYCKRMKKKNERAIANGLSPAPTPELPEIETFGQSAGGKSLFGGNSDSVKKFGTLPECLKTFTQAGVGFDLVRKEQELISVLPAGGPEQLVLIGAREDSHRDQNFQSQLYWVSLKQQRITGIIAITPGDYALDYDPESQLLLTFFRKSTHANKSNPDHYTVWKLEAGSTEAKPLVRWSVEDVSWHEALFAKIVSDRVVIAKTKKKTFEAWDFVAKKSLYTVKQESFFSAPVVLSPDRKQLILPQDGNVTVIDAPTGDVSLKVEIPSKAAGANINPAGTKLAAINSSGVYVWDLETKDPSPEFYSAPLIASPFSSRLDWIGDDQLLGESHSGRILYSLSLKLPIWIYEMDSSERSMNSNPLVNMVVDGMVFYVARGAHNTPGAAIGAVNLPGPEVAETIGSVEKEALYALHPGVEVSLDVSGVSEPDSVSKWLKEKINANGWVLKDNAPFKMVAQMGVGKSSTETYLGRGGRETTVSFTPHFADLKILRGDVTVWQSGTSTGAPGFLSGEPGTFQRQVAAMQTPQLKFFESVSIADRIIDSKYSHGFGKSRLGKSGIYVVSKTPPGRADDPAEAASQAENARMKSLEDRKR